VNLLRFHALNNLKCDNKSPDIWIYEDLNTIPNYFAIFIGNRVFKIRSTKNIVLKFYYVDENNKPQYITFNKNCQMIYDDRINDDGTPVEVPESVKTKPVHIEETELNKQQFEELMKIKEQSTPNGGKKRRSSHKKRRSSSRKKRRSSRRH